MATLPLSLHWPMSWARLVFPHAPSQSKPGGGGGETQGYRVWYAPCIDAYTQKRLRIQIPQVRILSVCDGGEKGTGAELLMAAVAKDTLLCVQALEEHLKEYVHQTHAKMLSKAKKQGPLEPFTLVQPGRRIRLPLSHRTSELASKIALMTGLYTVDIDIHGVWFTEGRWGWDVRLVQIMEEDNDQEKKEPISLEEVVDDDDSDSDGVDDEGGPDGEQVQAMKGDLLKTIQARMDTTRHELRLLEQCMEACMKVIPGTREGLRQLQNVVDVL